MGDFIKLARIIIETFFRRDGDLIFKVTIPKTLFKRFELLSLNLINGFKSNLRRY